MYGLEDQHKRPRFEFDLEKDIKKDNKLAKKLTSEIDSHLHEIEHEMKAHKASPHDDLMTVAHGYKAAKKVISKIH